MLQEKEWPVEGATEVLPKIKVSLSAKPDDYDDGLLATAIPIMFGGYTTILIASALMFGGSGVALLDIAVCGFYLLMYLGLPIAMNRMREKHDPRWGDYAQARSAEKVAIATGYIKRHEAVMQMTIVPVGLAFAFIGFAVVLKFIV